jgi:hypothetical protein
MALKQPQISDFLLGILVGIAKENGIPLLAGSILRAPDKFRKERIGDRRNEHSDGLTFLGAQTAGDPVWTVLETFDRQQNPVPGRTGNTRLPIDDRRDRLDRDIGYPGNVCNGRLTERAHLGE